MDAFRVAPPEAGSLASRIGNTPLLELPRLGRPKPGVRVLAKAEWFNPGGSVKDRPGWWMVRDGLDSRAFIKGTTLIDATSGNTGIAYAMICAALGRPVKLCIPANASPERQRILRAYGAELELTDPQEGTDGAILRVRELVEADPDRWFHPDQYGNPANPRSHYESTGPEIWKQTGGKVTHFVAGLGTSGTFCGTAKRLKEHSGNVECVSFQPDAPLHGLEGMKHMETAIVPSIYDPSIADRDLAVSTDDAQRMVVRLAREEGLLVGISSGAAMVAALEVAKGLDEGTIVIVFPDSGMKYLNESFWDRR